MYKLSAQKANRHFALDTVVINSLASQKIAKAYHVVNLNDSINNTQSLTALLERNSPVFVRQYGKAMVSALHIRGTGAAHTQVVWNGIPVNSILTGQTDLNTFSPVGFDKIYLKKGGSSVGFGSGAIGGVLVFEDNLYFRKAFHLHNQSLLGSFKTFVNAVNVSNSTQKWYSKFHFQYQKSQNDYFFPGFDIKNENGAYAGLDYGWVGGYKINKQHQVYFKSKISDWDRQTSRTLYMPQKAQLFTLNRYILTGWRYHYKHFANQTNVAYLYEHFRYFFNKELPENSFSRSQSYIVKNLSQWQWTDRKKFIIGNDFTFQNAQGEHINRHERKTYAVYAIWMHRLKKWHYQLKLRQDFNPKTPIPLTGAVELTYDFNRKHRMRANASHNFRLPTFNDLYWQPGGNSGLLPEDSYNFETGYDWRTQNRKIQLTFYYIRSRNLIKWVPVTNSFWQPQNFEQVVYKGMEFSWMQLLKPWQKWKIENKFDLNYQHTENLTTGKLLPFTPQWVANNNLSIRYGRFTGNYHYRYQGKIFTTTTNSQFLPPYQIHDVSLGFAMNTHISIQLNINNILNTYYETVPSRPMPGRYEEIILNFKL